MNNKKFIIQKRTSKPMMISSVWIDKKEFENIEDCIDYVNESDIEKSRFRIVKIEVTFHKKYYTAFHGDEQPQNDERNFSHG